MSFNLPVSKGSDKRRLSVPQVLDEAPFDRPVVAAGRRLSQPSAYLKRAVWAARTPRATIRRTARSVAASRASVPEPQTGRRRRRDDRWWNDNR
jgi:hypothetical protein